MARIVGAKPVEVICMNSLTLNLHLMLATFYRPNESRCKILIESPAFPSDNYAVQSHIAHHGFDPKQALIATETNLEEAIEKHRDELALVLIGGVNFFSGRFFNIERITAAAHRHGIVVGVDLAHAIGNVSLALHDWNVDFAVWCSYKYLNSGPGAVAGAFVHERHAANRELPRFAGWWGNDPATRFQMQLIPEFVPVASADAWAVSNPPILALAPLRASLAIFDEAGGMEPLREKSQRLTGYLEFLLDRIGADHFTIITPRNPNERGCQLSILAHDNPRQLFATIEAAGVKCDFREPNVIRVAPTPLYNTFHEVWRFGKILEAA
jgi:kynureninase